MFPAAIVDAFTDVPFAGNPAGIVLLDAEDREPAWMQAIAAEVGLAETAFVSPRDGGVYGLRWFTPTVEVELCGHATLAAAHWLWQRGEAADVVSFETLSGRLTALREAIDAPIWLDFPLVPVVDTSELAGWREAFPSHDMLRWIGLTDRPRVLERNSVLVTDAQTLRGLTPDFRRVRELACGGVIVTARSDVPEADVLTRYFAPACGVDEDPVTGSAHCTVGWYWAPILRTQTMRARQVSPRGGDLQVEVSGSRVRLGGRAVTVAELQLLA